MPQIRCQCGAMLSRPLPKDCPSCGVMLRSVRTRIWPQLLSLAIVVALFGVLVVVVLMLTHNL